LEQIVLAPFFLFGSVLRQEFIQFNLKLTQLVDFATNDGLFLRWLKVDDWK